jgi:hypothetical protein
MMLVFKVFLIFLERAYIGRETFRDDFVLEEDQDIGHEHQIWILKLLHRKISMCIAAATIEFSMFKKSPEKKEYKTYNSFNSLDSEEEDEFVKIERNMPQIKVNSEIDLEPETVEETFDQILNESAKTNRLEALISTSLSSWLEKMSYFENITITKSIPPKEGESCNEYNVRSHAKIDSPIYNAVTKVVGKCRFFDFLFSNRMLGSVIRTEMNGYKIDKAMKKEVVFDKRELIDVETNIRKTGSCSDLYDIVPPPPPHTCTDYTKWLKWADKINYISMLLILCLEHRRSVKSEDISGLSKNRSHNLIRKIFGPYFKDHIWWLQKYNLKNNDKMNLFSLSDYYHQVKLVILNSHFDFISLMKNVDVSTLPGYEKGIACKFSDISVYSVNLKNYNKVKEDFKCDGNELEEFLTNETLSPGMSLFKEEISKLSENNLPENFEDWLEDVIGKINDVKKKPPSRTSSPKKHKKRKRGR